MYWLIHFKVLEPSNKYAQKTVDLLDAVTIPVYNKIKSKIPTVIAEIDFAPFGVLLVFIYRKRAPQDKAQKHKGFSVLFIPDRFACRAAYNILF